MARKDIVVVGTSAGGVEALRRLAAGLPPALPAAIFVVSHMPSNLGPSVLPRVMSEAGPLPAHQPEDGEPIEPGRIYVAKADHHMLLENGYIRIAKGPKENRFRPAIDPLFRSAAYVYGPRVTGVVLSGALDDGTSGLWTIKLRGGTAVVQLPGEALLDSMPLSAQRNVQVDYCLPAGEIGALLGRLAREEAPPARAPLATQDAQAKTEVDIAAGRGGVSEEFFMDFGELTSYTCPECHGVLSRVDEGSLQRYRCHTGHAFTSSVLLDCVAEQVETKLWEALRAVDENAMLLDHIARHATEQGNRAAGERFRGEAQRLRERARAIRDLALKERPAEREDA